LDSGAPLALFVYGTLKKGFPAHERFFGKDAESERAVVRGSLFDLPAGYPALAVPDADILAIGTADARCDAARQRETLLACRTHPASGETISGEIFRLDPERLLPALDVFEGFDPNGESLYRRVLIPAWTRSGKVFAAWAYVMGSPSGERLPGGAWTPRGEPSP
jgi:gamma-glutamylcyclotransferase (GGCT)/AIG2-like uncharacterized protein YtfP